MKIDVRTKAPKKVREQDLIPGVIYGKEIDSVPVQIDELEFRKLYSEYGLNMTFNITLNGEDHIVYIKDIQNDYLKHSDILHFDLLKVSSEDTITSYVPLTFVNREGLAGVGEIVNINVDELEVEYNVGSGVSSIQVDLADLTIDEPLYVKDLEVPEGISVLTEADDVIASIVTIAEEVEEPEEVEEEIIEVEAIKQGPVDEEEKPEEE